MYLEDKVSNTEWAIPTFQTARYQNQQNYLLPFLVTLNLPLACLIPGEFYSLGKHTDYSVPKIEALKCYSTTNLIDDYFHNSVGEVLHTSEGRLKRVRPAGVLKLSSQFVKREKPTDSQEIPCTLNPTVS